MEKLENNKEEENFIIKTHADFLKLKFTHSFEQSGNGHSVFLYFNIFLYVFMSFFLFSFYYSKNLTFFKYEKRKKEE